MSVAKTSISWCDATWNPVRGCSRVSEGCRHCYAERMAVRFCGPGLPFKGFAHPPRPGTTVLRHGGWTGRVELIPSELDWPLHRRKPLRIFVNSMSDLFHEALKFEEIAAVYGVMAACPQHTFLALTKRPERAREWHAWLADQAADLVASVGVRPTSPPESAILSDAAFRESNLRDAARISFRSEWPLPNVWLGVSAEDQKTADQRIPLLLQTPAAHRWVSAEPLIGSIDLRRWTLAEHGRRHIGAEAGLSAVVVGGESGPQARACDVSWIRSIRDQCSEAKVPCFIKQDSGPRSEEQGRIPDDLWAAKELAW